MSCRVSAVVVAFAGEALLSRCIASLEEALAAVGGATELIVVLNRPHDAARALLEGRCTIVETDGNVGFTGGVAAGATHAGGEWLLLVNDDCTVAPQTVAALLAAGEASDDIGTVAAEVRFADDGRTINSAGIEVDVLGVAYERMLGEKAPEAGRPVVEVFGASGGAALYRRAMLDDVGGFDSSFFAYLEDADLAWRAQSRGWRCVHVPGAVVLHHHSASLGHGSGAKHFLVGRNRVRMLARNATRRQLLRHGLAMIAYDLAYVVYVAATQRSLAPLAGRLAGLREWRTYRSAGRAGSRPAPLRPPAGLRAALTRNRAYGRAGAVTRQPEAPARRAAADRGSVS